MKRDIMSEENINKVYMRWKNRMQTINQKLINMLILGKLLTLELESLQKESIPHPVLEKMFKRNN